MKKLNEIQLNEIEKHLTQETDTKHYRKLLTVKLWGQVKSITIFCWQRFRGVLY